MRRGVQLYLILAAALVFQAASAVASGAACPPGNGGINVPRGFCARVFAKNVGPLRHLVVAADGTVYAAMSGQRKGGGIAVLRDTNGDGTADSIKYFGDVRGTGIGIHDGYLYFGENTRIVRFKLPEGGGLPQGGPQVVVSGFPDQDEHATKSLVFGPDNGLFVGVGAPSNACQQHDRVEHSPGMDPCPLLAMHGGIWRFRSDLTGQQMTESQRFATGLRNMVALAWNHQDQALYGVMMGRDQLHDNWPGRFTVQQNAELPAEEFLRIEKGGDYGWPYCYYDGQQDKLVLAPEYGGDGDKVGRCGQYRKPLLAFPAHWAPEAMLFYTGSAFPRVFDHGAFVAFHGSWNRAPMPQKGFVVAFVPFKDGKPDGKWHLFANGFAGKGRISSPADARFRPVGIAEGPDGALYIADSQSGWIWRVTYGAGSPPKPVKPASPATRAGPSATKPAPATATGQGAASAGTASGGRSPG